MNDTIDERAVDVKPGNGIMACWTFWDQNCLEMQYMDISEATKYTLENIQTRDQPVESDVRLNFRHYRTAQRDGSALKALPYRSKTKFVQEGLKSGAAAIEFVDKFFKGSFPTGKVSSEPEKYREAYAACHDLLHSSSACCTACEKASKKARKSDAKDTTTSEPISRQTIEEAMDAYDQYRETGEHGRIFDRFGEPTGYWVRSTRERGNRVYPTKPLVGFILKMTDLNGGWSHSADAAARLHDAGYIIVNQDDEPITPPERDEH